MKQPTLNDIAAQAGLSNCVVSHVLHDDAYAARVRPETRKRILDIARKLGYRRNLLASATRTGHVNTIAVLLNFNSGKNAILVNQVVDGILLEASAENYSVKIFSDADPEAAFRGILENRITHVISTSVPGDIREKTVELAERYGLDLVFSYERGHGRFPAVNTDNAEMTSSAVRYLAQHGHARIGLLCVPHWAHYVEDRHTGYLRGMEECGLKTDPRWIRCSDDTEGSMDFFLSLPENERPTAFVALADTVAAEAQRFAWKRGLRVPEDFSVVGVGDSEAASYALVPITTFREDYRGIGRLLVRLLLGRKVDLRPDEFNVYRTGAQMVERQSATLKV